MRPRVDYEAMSHRPSEGSIWAEYRDYDGAIDPFFDEEEDEEEWPDVDLGGFPRGLDLIGDCLRVVWKDKEILAYQTTSLALISALLFVFMWAITQGFDPEYMELNANPVIIILKLFPFLVIASFVGTFFSAATIAVATIRMKGGNPTIIDGLETAAKKSFSIFGWAIVSAVWGTMIAILRSGRRGSHVAADVAQLAWGVATYFVVPVLLFEDEGPISAIGRSTSIVKRTWRESLAGNLGMGFVFLVLILLSIMFLFPIGSVIAGIAGGIAAAALGVIVVLVFSSAAGGVLVAALYWLARTGKKPVAMEGHSYRDFNSKFEVFAGPAENVEDIGMTADELTRKYAR